ncbi:FAD-dependent oxidoreductase [Mangrovicoccus algicola]|uniref:FAD-dependent oxidoreductase n=1 Tax=Mangrovicoccus algicola TaxID=2771008 RepID=A0A8J6YT49_9RHOB|nr:bifunctional TVP38/TMEM64 family protein/FAD-dependent oxidoreductase [Mangrovicoccus algicola]MBE3637322.1 FAD-dependent oxidoreductase [Mangrovicoccus algicola]
MKKPLLLIGLGLLVAGLLWLLRGQDLDLSALRAHLEAVADLRAAHPLAAAALFFAAYVAVTALSLPVALWLTLAGGALFGFWQGLVLVSFASAIGATLAFLVARYLARDWVRAKLGARAAGLEAGLARDGAFYLFSLRLIPVVPFFALNLLMGLGPIRARTFYWVSQAGMLAGTAVYVNAGTQLARLDSLSGLVSGPVLASFAALAAFPWAARGAIGLWRRRRAYAGWTRPKRFDRNLVVIGAGSAGLVSAYIAAAVKARVTLVEAGEMGGDCLNYGCVPSKTLIRSAGLARQMRRAADWGLTGAAPHVPFDRVMERVHAAIATIAPHDSVARYEGLGVEVIRGRARLIDPWTVEIAGHDGGTQRLSTRAVILATGARPALPPVPGLEEVGPLTSDTLWDRLRHRPDAPARLVVLGGGPIGCELAQAFARLGSDVTQIEAADRLLGREDAEVSELVSAALREDGVTVLTGSRATACGRGDGPDGGKWIEIETAQGTRRIGFDEILVATGRAARLEGMGLEEMGIPAGQVVETNDFLETRYPNILAAGDVAGPFQFTHTASHQAWYAAVNALFGGLKRFRADYRVIPRATFTDPEIARVGLSETEAQQKGIPHEVTRYELSGLDRAVTEGAAQGFVKVLTVPGRDRILGATIAGAHAGEMIGEFVTAMKHGLGLNKILGTIHVYPTWAEANKAAAGAWRRGHVNPRALRLLERFHRWRRG